MKTLFLLLFISANALAAGKIINADIAASGTANIALNKLAASTAHNACTFDSSGFIATGVAPGTSGNFLRSNGTDWASSALTSGNLTDVGTDGLVVTGGTGAVLGSGTSLAQHVADSTHNGYLSSTDWSTFNGKQAALTIGNLTDTGTDGITVTGGTGAVIGSGTSFAQHVADATHNGYLSSTDWSTFNGKQPAGTYVTSISVATANGLAGSSSGGATPALTLSTSVTGILSGNGTAISAASTTGSNAVVLATSPTITTPTIAKLANLTSNGYIKTSAGDGTLGVQAVPIPFGDGGTGQTSYTDGQLLIGNTSTGGLSKATISAGSNVTVTNGNGTITIAATGATAPTGYCMVTNSTNANGSSSTTVQRFSTVLTNIGSDITCPTDSATLGSVMTIVNDGDYAGGACDVFNSAANWCITINSTGLTSNCSAIADSQTMATNTSSANDNFSCSPFGPIHLVANDKVRVQTNGNAQGGSSARSRFWLKRIN